MSRLTHDDPSKNDSSGSTVGEGRSGTDKETSTDRTSNLVVSFSLDMYALHTAII